MAGDRAAKKPRRRRSQDAHSKPQADTEKNDHKHKRRHSAPAKHDAAQQGAEQVDVHKRRDADSSVKKRRKEEASMEEASTSWNGGVPSHIMQCIIKLLDPIDRQQFWATCSRWHLEGTVAVTTRRHTIAHLASFHHAVDVSNAFFMSSRVDIQVHPLVDPVWLQHALEFANSQPENQQVRLLPPRGSTPAEAGALLGGALKGLQSCGQQVPAGAEPTSSPMAVATAAAAADAGSTSGPEVAATAAPGAAAAAGARLTSRRRTCKGTITDHGLFGGSEEAAESRVTSLDLSGFSLSAEQLGQVAQLGRLRRLTVHVEVLDTSAVAQLLQLRALEALDCVFETFDPAYITEPGGAFDVSGEPVPELTEQQMTDHVKARRAVLGCCVALLALPHLSSLSLCLPALHHRHLATISSGVVVGGPFNAFVHQLAATAHQIAQLESLTVRTAHRAEDGSLMEESENKVISHDNRINYVHQEVSLTAPSTFATVPDDKSAALLGTESAKWSCFLHPGAAAQSVLGTPPLLTALTLINVDSAQAFEGLGTQFGRGELKHLKAGLQQGVWAADMVDGSLVSLAKNVKQLETLELYPLDETLEPLLPCFTDDSIAHLARGLTQLVTLKLHGVLDTQLAGAADQLAWKTPAVTMPFSTYETSATVAPPAAAAADAQAHAASRASAAAAPAAAAAPGSHEPAAASHQLALMPGRNEPRGSWRLLAALRSLRSLSLGHLGQGKEVLLAPWLPTQLTSLELRGIAVIDGDPSPSFPDLRCLRLHNCQLDAVGMFAAAPLTELAVTKHPYPLTLHDVAVTWPALGTLKLHDEGAESFLDLRSFGPLSQLTRLCSLSVGLDTAAARDALLALSSRVLAAPQLRVVELQLAGGLPGHLISSLDGLAQLSHLRSLTVTVVSEHGAAWRPEVSIVNAILRTCMVQTDVLVQSCLLGHVFSAEADAAMYSALKAAGCRGGRTALHVSVGAAVAAVLEALPQLHANHACVARALQMQLAKWAL